VVEIAGVTSMESQNSRYLTLLQVCCTANRTNVNQKDFTHLHILLYKQGGNVSPYLTQTRFKRQLPSFDATT